MASLLIRRGVARECRRAHVVWPTCGRQGAQYGSAFLACGESSSRASLAQLRYMSGPSCPSLDQPCGSRVSSALTPLAAETFEKDVDSEAECSGNAVVPTGTTALSRPALAASAVALVPESVEWSQTTWWLFESCCGIGSIKMGLGGMAAQVFFIVPSTVMQRIIAERSVGALPLLPYSAMFASGTIWVTYGALLGNTAIWLPNVPAVLAGAIYSGIYLRHCPAGADWLPYKKEYHAVGVVGILSVVLGASLGLEASLGAQVVGILGNVVTFVMFAGPLSAIRTVFAEKSTRSLPLGMCVMTVVNCSLWTFYGAAMLHDPLIWLPNSLGLMSGLVQLGLFMRFGIHK